MYDTIYKSSYTCSTCNKTHTTIAINDTTTVKEFSYNYYLPNPSGKCSWPEEDRYCVLVKWDDFKDNAETYINKSFDKKNTPISEKVKVRPQ